LFGFEKLEVWQLAIDYSDDVYATTKRQGFIEQSDFDRLYAAAEQLGRMLSGLKNSLES
jgi:hypothetical protein